MHVTFYAFAVSWLTVSSLFVSGAFAASSASRSDLSRRDTIEDPSIDIPSFIRSLDLPQSAVDSLSKTLESQKGLTSLLTQPSTDRGQLVSIACSSLQLILGSAKVDTKPVNQSLTEVNWSQTCWFSPTCVVLPASSKDVSLALKFITFFHTPFAVRSGGHSPNPGWASIGEPGILIDLQTLNEVSLSKDRKVASVGPGNRWGRVYEVLDPSNVTVIGGRIPHVGVGGLMLGGGLHHFSGQYGLAADNVKNFEIVLSNSTITNANAGENSDLFWALKGGGPNFGIVTRYDLNTFPIRNIWYQTSLHTPDQAPALIDAFTEWQLNGAPDLKGTAVFQIGLDIISNVLIYAEPADQPAAFAPFYDIPNIGYAVPPTNGTILSLSQFLTSIFANEPLRHDYRAGSSKIDAQLYKDVYAFWKEKATAVRAATGANSTYVLQPIPSQLVAAGNAKGGNPLGLSAENHQWWTTVSDWRDAKDDDAVRGVSIATGNKLQELAKAKGLDVAYRFMNDASRDQNPLRGYGEENLMRLREVAKRYDVGEVFQTLQVGGFLLARA